jgi:hypothetical protein
VRPSTARHRSRKESLFLPVFVLGFLVVHLALLPAHGLASHFMPMSSSTDTHASSSSAHGMDDDVSVHGGSSTVHEHDEHRHDGAPTCHADPDHTFAAPGRSLSDKLADPSCWFVAVTGALLLAFFALRAERDTRRRRWPTSPPWRPAGVDLLTHACISQV